MFTDPDGSLAIVSPLEALASQSGHATGASRPIITVTDAALTKILELRDEEADAEQLGLRLAIASGPGEEFRYDLSFDEFLKADFTDEVRTHTGGDGRTIKVIIPGADVDRLQDATLDYGDAQGLLIRNPNRPAAPNVEGLVQDDELSADVLCHDRRERHEHSKACAGEHGAPGESGGHCLFLLPLMRPLWSSSK